MNSKLLPTALVLSMLFAGGIHAKSVNPKHLQQIVPPVAHVLEGDVSVQGHNILYTLRAGTYLLMYTDRRGRYFIGDGNCMHLDIRTPKMTGTNDWTCGLYVPDDPSRGASFFRVRPVTSTSAEMGPVVNAIIRYGYGSFDWPDKVESMQLREKLTARKEP
ncbi:MAG: hypothetical protein ACRC6L_12425 [Steroidobacteraceae bacterium]